MNKLFLSFVASLCSLTLLAQVGVTQFMGVPVDGDKESFLVKMKRKGFLPEEKGSEVLFGTFNGSEVALTVDTHKGKVYRVLVVDAKTSNELQIKKRYNTLCEQFSNNPNYTFIEGDYLIADETDISFEMSVQGKTFESIFIVSATEEENLKLEERLDKYLSTKYSHEELAHPSSDVVKDNNAYFVSLLKEQEEQLRKRLVRLRISNEYGSYRIAISYDNVANQVNGSEI